MRPIEENESQNVQLIETRSYLDSYRPNSPFLATMFFAVVLTVVDSLVPLTMVDSLMPALFLRIDEAIIM